MDYYEVVTKLIGPIHPVGETHTDNARYENLKAFTELTNRLLSDIDEIASRFKDRPEFSVSRAGNHCDKFLDDIGIVE